LLKKIVGNAYLTDYVALSLYLPIYYTSSTLCL